MNAKLAELFQRKHFWEHKRDNLYNRIVWNYQQNAVVFLFLMVYIWVFFQRGTIFFTEAGWCLAVRIIILVISLFLWWFTLVRNVFDCCYKLPRYQRKICEVDHKIIEELKKFN
ncbi:hypothetical protein [endosymbiont DhMRE of Dentiscutata heterogama]|uniref:hypothetical protein n=1 Tax=endosymbiont DhMRE of Dentiscutata heterogama TaxID=1609546 RepID=UPI002AD57F5F|nr:hypothetical protein [endosymbiont DhMRE of Dentiscutata heterogama]